MGKEKKYASIEESRIDSSPPGDTIPGEEVSSEDLKNKVPPGEPASEASHKSASRGGQDGKNSLPPVGQPKILVVDDTSISRVILRNLLTRMGVLVVEASNGQEALWQIEKSDPDLVITDLSMPIMDGFTMMDKAQNGKGDPIPVIVVSVYADKERLVRAVRLGAVDYIVKPFEQETIIKKVTKVLASIRGKNLEP